ncbi:hypothetical protein VTI74DRAFT_9057 [Chaetomium olivicolor]
MSALTQRTALAARRLGTRTTLTSFSRAGLTTTVPRQKSALDSAKETLKSVDRKVSDKLVDGINIGTAYASKIKEATAEVKEGKVTGKAAELRDEMAGKASEVAGEAKGAASEAAGETKGAASEAKGKASEVAGEAKGTAQEMMGEAKGKASELAGEAKGVKEEVKGKVKKAVS